MGHIEPDSSYSVTYPFSRDLVNLVAKMSSWHFSSCDLTVTPLYLSNVPWRVSVKGVVFMTFSLLCIVSASVVILSVVKKVTACGNIRLACLEEFLYLNNTLAV